MAAAGPGRRRGMARPRTQQQRQQHRRDQQQIHVHAVVAFSIRAVPPVISARHGEDRAREAGRSGSQHGAIEREIDQPQPPMDQRRQVSTKTPGPRAGRWCAGVRGSRARSRRPTPPRARPVPVCHEAVPDGGGRVRVRSSARMPPRRRPRGSGRSHLPAQEGGGRRVRIRTPRRIHASALRVGGGARPRRRPGRRRQRPSGARRGRGSGGRPCPDP